MNLYKSNGDSSILEIYSKSLGTVCFIFDTEDFNRINSFKWRSIKNNGNYYAYTNMSVFENGKTKQSIIQLHRLLSSFLFHITDHADNNTLNNRKSNLRAATHSQNNMNKKRACFNPNGFKGVYFRKDTKKFRASIKLNNKKISLGHFSSAREAATAYNEAAISLFGEYALLNKVS